MLPDDDDLTGPFIPDDPQADAAPAETAPDYRAAISRVAATVEGLSREMDEVRRRQAKADRQAIMTFGILAVILWKLSGSKLPAPKVSVPDADIS